MSDNSLKPLIFTDIDDTLITTMRKIAPGERDDATVASTLEDGSPSGYRTSRLRQLRKHLENGDIVPVTARSRAAMARCDVPQAPAVCSNGGVIIRPDGTIDPKWHAMMQDNVGGGVEARQVEDACAQLAGDRFRHWIVEENGLPLYVTFKNNNTDEEAVKALSLAMADHMPVDGWRIHVNGNNLALSPPWLTKRAAVAYLIAQMQRETPDRLTIGIGDSVSDLGFMAECDFSMNPTVSQIGRQLAKGHDW